MAAIKRPTILAEDDVNTMLAWLDANDITYVQQSEHGRHVLYTLHFDDVSEVALFDLRWPNIDCITNTVNFGHDLGVVELPKGLRLDGSLFLQGCANLYRLPNRLRVGRILSLRDCARLVNLPNDLYVNSNLYLSGCRLIFCLPEGLCVGGSVILDKHHKIINYSEHTHVRHQDYP